MLMRMGGGAGRGAATVARCSARWQHGAWWQVRGARGVEPAARTGIGMVLKERNQQRSQWRRQQYRTAPHYSVHETKDLSTAKALHRCSTYILPTFRESINLQHIPIFRGQPAPSLHMLKQHILNICSGCRC